MVKNTCWLLIGLTASTLATGESRTPTPKRALISAIWSDPGAVESLDFVGGAGGRNNAPKPPFTFIEEELGGTTPKVKATDATGAVWSVKWGSEVNSDTFASRIAWAAGYIVQPTYFVSQGTIRGVTELKRAKKHVGPDGAFVDARFQLRDPHMKLLEDRGWTWKDNPFVGTHELNGLKIVMMLTSNWDNKDFRDEHRGSNTGILEHSTEGRTRWLYLVTDWGGSMGKWGNWLGREKWDPEGYVSQTSEFIGGVEDGIVKWGFHGQHTSAHTKDIRVSDLRWLLQYVGRISDSQIREGLVASGATPSEVQLFAPAIRARIDQMRSASKLGR